MSLYNRENDTLSHDKYDLLTDLTGKSLTVNVQDGQVTGDTEMNTR